MIDEIIFELALCLEDIEYVENILKNSNNASAQLELTTLANGFPSIALFYAQLNSIYPELKFKKLSHQYLEKSIARFHGNTLNTNSSFFSGITGLCFTVWVSSENGRQYQGLLGKIDSILFLVLDKKFKVIENKELFSPNDYDVIQGLSGVVRYLILRKHENKHFEYLKKSLRILIKISSLMKYNHYSVPSWLLSKNENIFGLGKLNNPVESFNVGVSHGVSGILLALSISKINNIQMSDLESSIFSIKNWILKWTQEDEWGPYWPNIISLEDELNGKYYHRKEGTQRQAWCYGTPGVSRALYLAGTALNDFELQEIALKAFLTIEKRPEVEWFCDSPTFCQGYSGLLQIAKRFYFDSKNKNILNIINRLQEKVISLYSKSNSFLFCEYKNKEGIIGDLKQIGLIEGATGTALSLIHTEYMDKCFWDQAFLIS
ncbi:lanthionine synthetase C family protein [Fluviispira multicolorata]|uniref:Lanthionine synthetase C-like protein n=1 Tax=Fluviispira multicolorata TaxID=2654512 RepID=A0A833JBT4_9BACT|nr:lanthionine synthetase C family protein [Fluviispira multicolorata]KAB8029143.1 hypothetical protein GCL57_11435 [Fluviispira multicolorata]